MLTRIGILAAALGSLAGCATLVTKDVASLDSKPHGVRIYPPRACLFSSDTETKLVYLPDFRRAYDVKPITILAKQSFKVELTDGQLTALTDDQDTTAFLSFASEAAKTAAQLSGVTATEVKGKFGLGKGIFCFGDDGKLEVVWVPMEQGR
jgi:hypothetical protein